ncbi:TolC family protein [Bdellovibrio sp. HCB337]|uniref:TolC family protein n=1 Tax=Bdellovibrio sp. HCB337 TaxID=3394358 RepID=UPI0039A4709B
MKWLLGAILFFQFEAHAQVFSLTLEQAEEQAFRTSPALKSAQASSEAAASQAMVSKSFLWPRISLDGTYYYQSNVPEADMGPVGTIKFGTHNNYFIGPVLSYTLFDGGQSRNNFESFLAVNEARRADYQARQAQLRLNLRVSYFRVQLALKSLMLTADALKLAQAQSHDIDVRFRAGASSRLDQVSANKDMLSYQMRFNQAQGDLGRALRDLFSLTGGGETLDTSRPIPNELTRNIPAGVESPSLVVQLDTPEKSLEKVLGRTGNEPALNHPELVSLEKITQASQQAAESAKGGYWPLLQLQAKAQWIYPNLVIPEQAWQNTLGVNLVFPLFEGNLTPNQVSQRNSEALASDFQRQQRQVDFQKDWRKIQDGLENLKRQQKINQQTVKQSHEIEKLTYQAYRSGRVRFLDVQSANFRLLESQVNAAEIDHQILEQNANLEYLASQAEDQRR